ncbi:hypothetical protein CHLORIS_144 [Vibrio phage Chloris]|nr:hypothetical protein IW18_145 [Vibrio phage IW18]WBU76553.1 hypothetical protein CHLORIS_144 [Vibrio phage Chloris]
MNKLKLLTLAVLTSVGMSGAALANTINADFSTNLQSYCTIGQTSPGIMHLDGKALTTDTPAQLVVNNNDAGVYQVSINAPADFTNKPNSYSGTTSFTSAFGLQGQNNTDNPVANGATHALANSGTDNMSVSLFGTSTTDFTAGNYSAVVVASCVAQ